MSQLTHELSVAVDEAHTSTVAVQVPVVTSWSGLDLAHQAALRAPRLIMLHLRVLHFWKLLVAYLLAQLFVRLHPFSPPLSLSLS